MRFSKNNRALLKTCKRERGTRPRHLWPRNSHPSSSRHPWVPAAASILQAQPCLTSRQAPRLATHPADASAGMGSPSALPPARQRAGPDTRHFPDACVFSSRQRPTPSSSPHPSHRAGEGPKATATVPKSKPARWSHHPRPGHRPASQASPRRARLCGRRCTRSAHALWARVLRSRGKLGLERHTVTHAPARLGHSCNNSS